ncbi:MAG TPA: phytoene/squalene synthase family protein [Verrucomicrobiae bacterium]|nr:phytoene/squalene synthase family protein [Verrucomicrobiae bacterium]
MNSTRLNDLLKNVSRSFYLTLRVLPRAVRSQIGLAYLLARATDTVADTEVISVEARIDTLRRLRQRISGESKQPLQLSGFGSSPEQELLQKIEQVFEVFTTFSPSDQQRIRELLEIIAGGQELDLMRFGNASERNIIALKTPDELDDYTYRVAGCVGEFWTRMCRAHLFSNATLDDKFLFENGVRFGKGLQLVNILRDIPRDLRNGRCYLPLSELTEAGLRPSDLLSPTNESGTRPIYDRWLARAESHLRAGWEYTNALPRRAARVRLACAWPILIGLRTLNRLKIEPVLDPARRIKVSRPEVRHIMLQSALLYPFPGIWRRQVT